MTPHHETVQYVYASRLQIVTSLSSQTVFSGYRFDHYGVGSVPSRCMLGPLAVVRYFLSFEAEVVHGANPPDAAISSRFLDHRSYYDADVYDPSRISLWCKKARSCL